MAATGGRTIDWNHPRSWDEACARHAARKRWNSLRQFLAEERRQRLLELVLELGGLERGMQTKLAQVLGVDKSTVSRDVKRLMPLETPCPTCGVLRPRRWLDEEDMDGLPQRPGGSHRRTMGRGSEAVP